MPDRIGHYRITAGLGEGGMGVVYAAIDEKLDRTVALKVIRRDAGADAEARDRFWREARLAASVNHPHICQLYEIGEDAGQLFIAMERLEGESLATRLGRGAVPVADAVPIVLQLLGALDSLQRRGITHRDLKPSNIFLTAHGAKLLDFGLARALAGATDATRAELTTPGAIVGTPRYMAPEQIEGHIPDSRADVFAMGAILYEMLAGRPAFDAASLPALVEQVLRGDVAMLGGSPAIAAADRVIHRAMAKAPAGRYASAGAMAEDLRTVLTFRPEDEPSRARAITRLIVLPFRLLRPDPDVEFLSFGLADAVTNSLSSLESLVVRSTLAATRFAAAVPDLARIATDADVDVVVSGTLLRAGDQLRVSTQLIEVPAGTVRWSDKTQVSLGDVFQLQDALTRRIVESLALPLSTREDRAIAHDVPASAKAYEFYLRANQLSQDLGTWELARDLYLQCVQADPRFAPAWARLGRMYRIIGKYHRAPDENAALAESALNRALELNPDLSIADHYYAQLEVDRGRAQEAMVRLIRRASVHSGDSDLFAALVSVCRYCGLLQVSLAAHERARRLDPNVRTSVQYTLIMAGDYAGAAAESGDEINMGSFALASAGDFAAAAQRIRDGLLASSDATGAYKPMTEIARAVLAIYAGQRDPTGLRAAIDRTIQWGFRDPEGLFIWTLELVYAGDRDRSLKILADVVARGFYPYDTFARHPFLDPLRDRPAFKAILREAERRQGDARAAFIDAGGQALMGVEA